VLALAAHQPDKHTGGYQAQHEPNPRTLEHPGVATDEVANQRAEQKQQGKR